MCTQTRAERGDDGQRDHSEPAPPSFGRTKPPARTARRGPWFFHRGSTRRSRRGRVEYGRVRTTRHHRSPRGTVSEPRPRSQHDISHPVLSAGPGLLLTVEGCRGSQKNWDFAIPLEADARTEQSVAFGRPRRLTTLHRFRPAPTGRWRRDPCRGMVPLLQPKGRSGASSAKTGENPALFPQRYCSRLGGEPGRLTCIYVTSPRRKGGSFDVPIGRRSGRTSSSANRWRMNKCSRCSVPCSSWLLWRH